MNPNFKVELSSELQRVLQFWKQHALDQHYGGFIGRMDGKGIIHPHADKGLVLNARILWSFSAVYNFNGDLESLHLAEIAYQYLQKHFYDHKNGGLYWSVDYTGKPASTRNQIYGLAFAIYGLSEYYAASQHEEALQLAIHLFNQIEKHSYDPEYGGYFEAFTQDWQVLEDLRLSEKDRNDPKTMNTHLHLIEGYANLYKVWPDPALANKIRHLADLFKHKILQASGHLGLFFSVDWQLQSPAYSYGHDIEAAWLLLDCVKVLGDAQLTAQFEQLTLHIADAASEGLNTDGSFNHEFDPATGHTDRHREWWVSAEGMLGYWAAYQISGDTTYFSKIERLWAFIQVYLIDQAEGEWLWGVYADYSRMLEEDKIGFWKCPYHNTRALVELLRKM
jgi:mannobiose 2-epimerase